jgi:transcriptional regulator with XRE-family HTH domain
MRNTTDLDRLIGKNIRFHREKRGLSQEDVGRPIEVSFQQMQKYESGTNRIAASKLFLISDYFGVPVEAFRAALPTDASCPSDAPSGLEACQTTPADPPYHWEGLWGIDEW